MDADIVVVPTTTTSPPWEAEPEIPLVAATAVANGPHTSPGIIQSASAPDKSEETKINNDNNDNKNHNDFITTTTASVVSGYKVPLLLNLPLVVDYQVTVPRNIWWYTTTTSIITTPAITYTDSAQPFPLQLQTHGGGNPPSLESYGEKATTTTTTVATYNPTPTMVKKNNMLVVMDYTMDSQQGRPCALIRQNDAINPDKFHVFGFVPLVPNQKPSTTIQYKDEKDGSVLPLYTWGSLTNVDSTFLPYNSRLKFQFLMTNGWQYTAEQSRRGGGGFWRGLFSSSSGQRSNNTNNNNNNTKHPHIQYTISVATHSTTVGPRNVQTHVGTSNTSYAHITQPMVDQDWNVHVKSSSSNNYHDPAFMIILTVLLDELHRLRLA